MGLIGDESDCKEDDSEPYLTDTIFQLHTLTEPPVLGEEDAALLRGARAKKMQQLLDDQVQRLMSSSRMMKFLCHEISDLLQCRKCHRQHIRQLLEILLNKLQIECRIHETSHGSNSVFELQDGQRRHLAAAFWRSFQSTVLPTGHGGEIGKDFSE